MASFFEETNRPHDGMLLHNASFTVEEEAISSDKIDYTF